MVLTEDDDYDQQSYRNQRQRQDVPPGTRIRRGLLAIAENQYSLPHEDAMKVAKLVTENYEDDYIKDTFSAVSLRLVVEQPFKIPLVAATVQGRNCKNILRKANGGSLNWS